MKVIVNRNQYNKVLKETRGYSKSVENWGDYVTDELLPLIIKQDVEEDVYTLKKLSLKLKNKNFYEDIPIDSIIMTVIINDVEGDSADIKIGYNPYYTQIIENDDNSYNILDVEFDVIMNLPIERGDIEYDTLHYYFSSFLSHEFMHVYEWVNRNLETPKEIKGCEEVYKNGDINGDAVDRIGHLLYVIQSFELNAFVQQAATMISKLGPKNYDEFLVFLKDLPIYLFSETMLNFDSKKYLSEINDLTNDRKSELYKIIMCFYHKEGRTPKIKSIDRFLNDLEKKFKITGESFKRKLLRLITVI
jgi:hypothetical protein